MPIRTQKSTAPRSSTKSDFASRLRNYSRMVSNKIEFNRQSTGKLAGMSAAACAALSAHESAEAAIRYSGPVNVSASASYTWAFQNATFNIDDLASFGVSAAWFPSYSIYGLRQVALGTLGGNQNILDQPGPNGEEIGVSPGWYGWDQVDQFAEGDEIGPDTDWFAPNLAAGNINKALINGNNYNAGSPSMNWTNPAYPFIYYSTNPAGLSATATGFAAIRFDSEGGEGKHYGWVRLKLTNNFSAWYYTWQVSGIEVLDWAYETTPDTPILAGALPEELGGDYNGDGVVDAADYTVFRDNEGESLTLPGEDPGATTPGVVDDEDYDFWASQYGEGSSSASAVPEPAAAMVLSLGLLATGASGLRRHRRAQVHASQQDN